MSSSPFVPPLPFSVDRPRPQFQAALAAALARPIVTVTAPGGFGKTCALRLFWRAQKRPHGWLGARDGTPEDLAAALEHCGDKGLLVVDACEKMNPALAEALATAIDEAGPGISFILSGRNHAPLPLARWRSQGRISALNAHHLALSQQEWQDADLSGEAEDWCGWWGARLASVHPNARRDPELAAWLAEAWLGALADETVAALGRVALLPEARAEWLVALGTGSQAQAESILLAVAVEAGPLCLPGGGLRLAPRFRPYLVEAWRTRSNGDWLAAVETGTTVLLDRGELALAAELAMQASDATGNGELPIQVLREAGWRLLFGRDRPWLRKLLDATSTSMAEQTHTLLEAAWRVEVMKRPHDAEADAGRLASSGEAGNAGPATALLASIAYQYDSLPHADEHARNAMAQIGIDQHPAYVLAELVNAGVGIVLGDVKRADGALTHVLACASRDKLDYLQLQALHGRALLGFQTWNFDVALRYCGDRRARIRAAGLESAEMLDPSARLEAIVHLRRLDTLAAHRALEAGRAATQAYGDYWHFPYSTLDAIALLIDGDAEGARNQVERLEQEIAERFVGQSWRMESLLPRLWLRARDADNEGLLDIAARVATENWPESIYRDRRDLLCEAARLLAGETPDLAKLQALAVARAEGGASNVAAQARRLLALANEDAGQLLEEVRLTARNNDALDWLWLAPRSLGPLEALLAHPKLGADPIARPFLRSLVQRLLAPTRGTAPGGTDKEQPPPAGLTPKEWTILQLIGEQFTNDQIAAKLFVSLATIKTHINHIYSKLDIRTRAEAVHRARTLGG